MPDPLTPPLVFVIAQGTGQGNILVNLFPFVLMIGIFYLLVLMPMRKRQKKVQEFQSALKVGDRIVTTGGIYGQVTRLSDATVQVQIADKVRIEMSRAAIGGYQGQEPVVQSDSGGTLAG